MRSPGRLRASPAELRVLRQSAGLFRNVVAVWDADGFLTAGEGAYSFITEAPGDGYLYVRNGALHDWVRLPADGAGVTISVSPPVNPLPGWLWFDPVGTQLYVWYDDGTSQQWVIAVNNGGVGGGGGIPEAPLTGGPYGRQAGNWVAITGVGGIPEAPLTGGPYARFAASWVDIAVHGGVF